MRAYVGEIEAYLVGHRPVIGPVAVRVEVSQLVFGYH